MQTLLWPPYLQASPDYLTLSLTLTYSAHGFSHLPIYVNKHVQPPMVLKNFYPHPFLPREFYELPIYQVTISPLRRILPTYQ